MNGDGFQAPLTALQELLAELGEDSFDNLPAIDPEFSEEAADSQEPSLPFTSARTGVPRAPKSSFGYNLDWIASKLLRDYGLGFSGRDEICELLSFPTQPLYATWEGANNFLDNPHGIVLAYFWLEKTSLGGPVGLIGIADSADKIYSQVRKADSFDLQDPNCPELLLHDRSTVPDFSGAVSCLFGNSNGFYDSLARRFKLRGLSHLISAYSLNSYE